MGLADWWCCCRGALAGEKEPLVGHKMYTAFGAMQASDEENNLWSTPQDISHMEADDDRILYNLLVLSDKLDKGSEKWQRLNYNIRTVRQVRKEVRNRWKHILEDLELKEPRERINVVIVLDSCCSAQNPDRPWILGHRRQRGDAIPPGTVQRNAQLTGKQGKESCICLPVPALCIAPAIHP
ncbi:melanoregulin isoform X2 [Eublepharis macularius]|uniref:Melanoregulin isoform X2 n=1 Tax=Eublepharis macularius TaxID=481883 RepID=A0AA97IYA8_EUBMA|nr:melanoregulin isoform X2 [Eublepharis macularius]